MSSGVEAYPLCWPVGWRKLSDNIYRSRARFKTSFAVARDELVRELALMGAEKVIISTNIPLRRDGLPYAGQAQPKDPGVAVYFQLTRWAKSGKRETKPMVFACDTWDRVEDNLQAIRHTVGALRGIERWGASDMMERAFTGFAALPQPAQPRHWREVLGYGPNSTPSAEGLKSRHRELALKHHPDRGGDAGLMAEINRAAEQALEELAGT